MKFFSPRLLVAPALALAMVIPASPAHAMPSPPPLAGLTSAKPSQGGGSPHPELTDTRKLSKTKKAQIALGVRIIKYSSSQAKNGRRTIDYRRADKFDQGHPTARRRVIAGWLFAGGKVSHISKAELAKVRTYIPKGNPYKGLPKDGMGSIHCTGKSKTYYPKGKLGGISPVNFTVWYNSCETRDIVFNVKVTGFVVGVIGVGMALNPVTAVAGILTTLAGTAIGIMGEYITHVADHSETNSVWMRNHYYIISMGPQ